jgi:protein-S-isoprenylcysteine O-methyltransferase Ste14
VIAAEILRGLAGIMAYATLAVILFGVWRGSRRGAGRMSGPRARWLAVPWFYLATTALFFGIGYALWKPLPLPADADMRTWMCAIGSVFYIPGMALVLWGRLALGRNYFVSSILGVRLFEDHQLVTTGPFGVVRHPMYLGLMTAALGSLLMYLTWTAACFAILAPLLLLRARVEERILAVEFGEAWHEYCGRVPMLIPGYFASKSRLLGQGRVKRRVTSASRRDS